MCPSGWLSACLCVYFRVCCFCVVVYLFVCVLVCLFVCLSDCLPGCMSVCLSVCLSVCFLSACLSACVFLSFPLSFFLYLCVSLPHVFSRSARPFVCCLFVRRFVCVFVCSFIFLNMFLIASRGRWATCTRVVHLVASVAFRGRGRSDNSNSGEAVEVFTRVPPSHWGVRSAVSGRVFVGNSWCF